MDNLVNLLKKVSLIVARDKIQQEEKRKRGENFNIFKTLGMQTSEVRLHSAFLAELLNPNGSHGLKDKFLKAFLNDVVNQENFKFESSSAEVHVEYDIGRISEDGKSGGRIDLFLKDKNGNAIIIENKIYAGDQKNQLLRYNNYAKKKFKVGNYVILYLTLDRYNPSEESTGKSDDKKNEESQGQVGENPDIDSKSKVPFDYLCISYRQDILNWLEHCLELSARHPLIRETIQQYIINLKDILNIMEEINMNEFYKILEDYPEATAAILINNEGYKKHIYNTKVRPKLIEEANKIGLIFEDRNIFDRGDKAFLFYKKEWTYTAIYMCSEWKTFEKDFYWGVSTRIGKPFETKKHKLELFDQEPTDWHPYGWQRLGKYKDWYWDTYTAMVRGDYTKYIIDNVKKILEEIENKQLPMP